MSNTEDAEEHVHGDEQEEEAEEQMLTGDEEETTELHEDAVADDTLKQPSESGEEEQSIHDEHERNETDVVPADTVTEAEDGGTLLAAEAGDTGHADEGNGSESEERMESDGAAQLHDGDDGCHDEDLGGSPSKEDAIVGTCGQAEDQPADVVPYVEADEPDVGDVKVGHTVAIDPNLEPDGTLTDQPDEYQRTDERDTNVPHEIGHVHECRGIPTPPPLYNESEDTLPLKDDELSPCILNLLWSYGVNRNIAVKNLSSEKTKAIFYACSNVGVVYHFVENRQMLLQGHSNNLSCICTSADRRWLVTADKGPNSMVIIWDANTGTPVKTIFECDTEGGCVAVALSRCARYLATLSTIREQTLAIWDWTTESDVPVCTAKLKPSYGTQTYLYFNPEDLTQLVSNSESQVVFYRWFGGKIEYFAPPLTDEDFNKPVGKFSQTIYFRKSSRALSATHFGNMVVWDSGKALSHAEALHSPDKKALKIVRIQEKPITVLTISDDYIVSADVQGQIKFFDQTLKLLHQYQDFLLGPINSLSFANTLDVDYSGKSGGKYPTDSTMASKTFVVRDFVVGTSTAIVANVTVDGTDVKIIHKEHDDAVHAVAVHPSKPMLVIGSFSGILKLWQYKKRKVIATRTFEKSLRITCCKYDPKGELIAIGFTNGYIQIVDSVSLENCLDNPFNYSRHDAISHIAFSHDSHYMATADVGFAISVYEKTCSKFTANPYKYLGRYRAHYKKIRDIMFGVKLDSDEPRLLSLGEDRLLVEYNLADSLPDDIRLYSSDRIEQSGVPNSMLWYPPITKESFILTANSLYKFKLYNSTTRMCRKTVLGPTYGSPIQKMILLPVAERSDQDQYYLAYMINNKVGLAMLPPDGNPHRAAALIAHPQGVSDIACSHDGQYLFTVGGKDCTVNMWKINYGALEAQARLGGDDLVPFFGLLEGGEDGELFREMQDYFYYAQLKSQGINVQETREVSTKIPLTEVPSVMRALGFYPTEQEIEEMLNEVKFGNFVETGSYETEIDLQNFIRLYVNHRPAFGLQPEQVQWAFEVLGSALKSPHGIDRTELLELLQTRGEPMTEAELADHLSTLLGFGVDAGGCRDDEDTPSASDLIDQRLPQTITADLFVEHLLGFGPCPDPDDQQDALPSAAGDHDDSAQRAQQPACPLATEA